MRFGGKLVVGRAVLGLALAAACQAASPKPGPEPGDRCQAACQRAYGANPRIICGPDVEGCAVACAAKVTPASPACGECLLSQVSREPGYCNERECICDRVSTGSYEGCLPACAPEQAAADARDATDYQDRLRGPRPQPTGRAPELVVDLPALSSAYDAAVDPQGRLWVLGWPADGDWSRLTVLDRALAPQWTRDFSELRPYGAESVALLPDGGAWISAQSTPGKSVRVVRMGADGSTTPVRDDRAPGDYTRSTRLRALPDGRLLMIGANLGLSVLDPDGGLVWRGDPPGSVADGAAIDVAVDAAGDWIVAQNNAAVIVRKLRLMRDEDGVRRLKELWRRRVEGTGQQQSFPRALALDAAGNVTVVGELAAGSIRTAFVARIDRDGQLLWTWTAPGAPSIGELTGVAVDRAGDVIAAGHIDRVETYPQDHDYPRCPPEQTYCSALYVVKVRGDGTLAWDYQHRGYHSVASAALVDDQGRPLVLGWIDAVVPAPEGLAVRRRLSVLRFAP